MAAILKVSESDSSIVRLKNNPATFHPDPIWNDGTLGFFEERRTNNKKKNNNKMSSDARYKYSVKYSFRPVIPGPIMVTKTKMVN